MTPSAGERVWANAAMVRTHRRQAAGDGVAARPSCAPRGAIYRSAPVAGQVRESPPGRSARAGASSRAR